MKFKAIFRLFPKRCFDFLSQKYKVDHKVHKLDVQTVFRLILHALFSIFPTSLRALAGNFNNEDFQKILLKNHPYTTITHSALHYRLNNIDPDYFKSLYEILLKKLLTIIKTEKKTHNLIQFDSTIVSLSAKLLNTGFQAVGKNSKSKSLKFTMDYSQLPEKINLYTSSDYKKENAALGETLLETEVAPKSIILFDRGLASRKIFDAITKKRQHVHHTHK